MNSFDMRVYTCLPLMQIVLHFVEDGKTAVIATVRCNVSALEIVRRGLPGMPENFKILHFEEADGSVVENEKTNPPQTVYVVGTLTRK